MPHADSAAVLLAHSLAVAGSSGCDCANHMCDARRRRYRATHTMAYARCSTMHCQCCSANMQCLWCVTQHGAHGTCRTYHTHMAGCESRSDQQHSLQECGSAAAGCRVYHGLCLEVDYLTCDAREHSSKLAGWLLLTCCMHCAVSSHAPECRLLSRLGIGFGHSSRHLHHSTASQVFICMSWKVLYLLIIKFAPQTG